MSPCARYFSELACAFIRGHRADAPTVGAESLMAWGKAEGLRLHKFKRNAELPRVKRVLGILRGFGPQQLVDVGSGRGTFLWPLLNAFPTLAVTAVDIDPQRVRDLQAVQRGGVERLRSLQEDAGQLSLPSKSADVVCLLEVLEHMRQPQRAAEQALRIARTAVIASVPSKEDNNPEHIQLFTGDTLTDLLLSNGAKRVAIEYVRGHIVAIARPA